MYDYKPQLASGHPLLQNQNGQDGLSFQIEMRKQDNRFLEQAGELAAKYGSDFVLQLMQSNSFTQASLNIFDHSASDTSPTLSGADLVGEVEALGLEMNPCLISLITKSTVKQVKTAIARYKTYYKLSNPKGLFYTILKNQHKSNESNF